MLMTIKQTVSRDDLRNKVGHGLTEIINQKEASPRELVRFYEPAAKLLISIYESMQQICLEGYNNGE